MSFERSKAPRDEAPNGLSVVVVAAEEGPEKATAEEAARPGTTKNGLGVAHGFGVGFEGAGGVVVVRDEVPSVEGPERSRRAAARSKNAGVAPDVVVVDVGDGADEESEEAEGTAARALRCLTSGAAAGGGARSVSRSPRILARRTCSFSAFVRVV